APQVRVRIDHDRAAEKPNAADGPLPSRQPVKVAAKPHALGKLRLVQARRLVKPFEELAPLALQALAVAVARTTGLEQVQPFDQSPKFRGLGAKEPSFGRGEGVLSATLLSQRHAALLLCCQTLLESVEGDGHRYDQEGQQPPGETPLPDPRRGLLVSALALRIGERLGMRQLALLRQPFRLGSLLRLLAQPLIASPAAGQVCLAVWP